LAGSEPGAGSATSTSGDAPAAVAPPSLAQVDTAAADLSVPQIEADFSSLTHVPPAGPLPVADILEPAAAVDQSAEVETWRDSDHLVLPLPPAPPGERGYRPGDVERLMQFFADALNGTEAPGPGELAGFKLSRTFFVGQGYHAGVVDAVRRAWVEEFERRAL